jgi:tight adherence protein C
MIIVVRSLLQQNALTIKKPLTTLKFSRLIHFNCCLYRWLTIKHYKWENHFTRVYGQQHKKEMIKQFVLYKIAIIQLMLLFVNVTLLIIQLSEVNILVIDLGVVVLVNHIITLELKKQSDIIIEAINTSIPTLIDEIIIHSQSGYTLNKAIEKSIDQGIFLKIRAFKTIENSYFNAMEKFARRYNVQTFNKLTIILQQSHDHGNENLMMNLRTISVEAWSKLDRALEKKVSQIEAQLYIPIIIMFIGVLLIIIAPAFLNMLTLV